MQRLFINSACVRQGSIIIADKNILHHLKDVLRLRPQEESCVVDERGIIYHTLVDKLSSEALTLKIIKKEVVPKTDKAALTIACAVPKKSKFDDIIDKLTQLGVDRIIPMQTERVVVKWDKRQREFRLERWKKIALSASEQAQRKALPAIEPLKTFREVLKGSAACDLKLIPALIEQRLKLREALGRSRLKDIIVLIGPEGDFTPQEVCQAKAGGFIPVTLGEQVLRVETAAVAAASFIKLYEND